MVYSVTAADINDAPIKPHGSEVVRFTLGVLARERNAKAADAIPKYKLAVAELVGTEENHVTVLSMEQTTSEAIKVAGGLFGSGKLKMRLDSTFEVAISSVDPEKAKRRILSFSFKRSLKKEIEAKDIRTALSTQANRIHGEPCVSDGDCISRDCDLDGAKICNGPGGYFAGAPAKSEHRKGSGFDNGKERANSMYGLLGPLLRHMQKRGTDQKNTHYTSPGLRLHFPNGKIKINGVDTSSPFTLAIRYSVTSGGFESISKFFNKKKFEDRELWEGNAYHVKVKSPCKNSPPCGYFYVTMEKKYSCRCARQWEEGIFLSY